MSTHGLAPRRRDVSKTPLNGPRVLALFSVEVSDIAEGESVALVLGTREPIAMSPPSPTCPRWSLSVVLPSASRKLREGGYSRSDFVVRCNYSYGIIGADGQLKRREDEEMGDGEEEWGEESEGWEWQVEGEGEEEEVIEIEDEEEEPAAEEGGGRRLMADDTPHLVFFKDTYGMWEDETDGVSLRPAEGSTPGPSESFVFGSSPPPALYATVPPDQPPTFPDRVKIWRPSSAWSDGTPNVIDFRGASQLTRQLVVHIACNAISEGSARDLLHRGAEADQIVKTDRCGPLDDMSLPQLAAEHLDEPEAVGVMRVLLDAGAPILPPNRRSDHDSALHTAALAGKWGVLDVMLEPQYGISVAGQCLLAAVCRSESGSADKLRVVKMLGERDVTVLSEKGDDGWRPIHHFSSRPLSEEKLQEQLIDYLAEKLGTDVVNTPVQHPPPLGPGNIGTRDGKRPLSLAHLTYGTYRSSADATIERLYRYGAARHINTPDRQGNTVLRNAASNRDCPSEALVSLLEHGASVATAGLTQQGGGITQQGGGITQQGRRARLLTAYSSFLNESIPRGALQTINEALRPSRSLMASLSQPIPLRSRTIALPSGVLTTINGYLAPTDQTDSPPPPITIGDEPIGTQINQAVRQYVTAAARVICQPVPQQQEGSQERPQRHGNVRVVGGDGVAALRCFAIGGAAQPRQRIGVCEIIARAVRLEASRYDIGVTLRHNIFDDTHVLGALAVV
ncbi:unnamed protein product [Vitrella brassicaformis CCMP3155]|uniref:Uncharacterized protein n=1 Tax=Vitrella brassicaformis (strain CCMP3155) TaxID=1169540 RepID=A0A0G4EV87_VITBC|nr:unnamed protein product [Vitrella brassicaformis CCMP3155]|eukprot:CEM02258.1 unnamed protein product [Vitrella brassicaformis CCMP3155]